MCVVSVRLRHCNSDKEVSTLALLDTCSQGTFVTDNLLKKLGLSGVRTSINIRTLNGNKKVTSSLIEGLMVSKQPLSKDKRIQWVKLPKLYSREQIPVDSAEIATPEKLRRWRYLDSIAKEIARDDKVSVDLLIGANCIQALEPISVISSQDGGPYALQTILGWCIVGPIECTSGKVGAVSCNRIAVNEVGTNKIQSHHFEVQDQVKESGIKEMFERMYQLDFNESSTKVHNVMTKKLEGISYEDKKFLKLMDDQTVKVGNHYQTPLPLRNPVMKLPNNRKMVERRAQYLKKRFEKDPKYFHLYKEFMEEILSKGYAKISTDTPTDGRVWYLPHHGVYHPTKPNKIRVVFDCSVEYAGRSINKELMAGPDLTNQIVGTLIRFRQERIAFVADIEKMFFQVLVSNDHRNLLRFLWWQDWDLRKEPVDHEMCVHVFGGTSSPSCSNYALKRTSIDGKDQFGLEAAKTLQNNFYVDDLLKSVAQEDQAIQLIENVKAICLSGGFKLTKFLSNNKRVLQSIPEEDRRKGVKDKDLVGDLPSEQALRVLWNTEIDNLGFKVTLKQKPMTRRGLLSIISSVYDPLGLSAPFLLQGRLLNQELCRANLGWDEVIPEKIQIQWTKWEKKLKQLEKIAVERCYKPAIFGTLVECSLHHFADACEYGYGQVSYLRLVDNNGRIHCSLMIGKARVAPLKVMTIPRMELVAATLSVKMSILLKSELEIPVNKEVFRTDSEVVLGYIRNESKRFKIFVANRVELIKDHSDESQWHYINSKQNPADYASRGIDVCNDDKVKRWYLRPQFLWEPEATWDDYKLIPPVNEKDPELKKEFVVCLATKPVDVLTALENRISDWSKMVRVVALVIKFKEILLSKVNQCEIIRKVKSATLLNTSLLQEAKTKLVKMVQQRSFKDEFRWLKSLKNSNDLKKSTGQEKQDFSLGPILGWR